MQGSFLQRSGMWMAAKIVQACIMVFIFLIYSISLSKGDYGNYQKAFVLIGFLSAVLCFGLPVYIAALPQDTLQAHLGNLFKKVRWIVITAAITIFALVYIFFPQYRSPEILIVLMLSVVNATNLVYEVYALKKSGDALVWKTNFTFSILYLVLHLLVLVDYYLFYLLIFLLLAALLRLIIFVHRYGLFSGTFSGNTTLQGQAYFRQWVFISLNEGLEAFSKYVDKIVLIALLTAAEFAIYFNGSHEIPLLGILVGVAGTFTNVQIAKYAFDNHQIQQLFHSVTALMSTFVFPLFFFSVFYAGAIFNFLFESKYDAAVPFFIIYAWIIPLRIANYSAILQAKMKGHLVTAGSVSALLLKLLLMVLLYQVWGVQGIAMACVAGTYYQVFFYLIHIARALEVSFINVLPLRKLGLIFFVAAFLNIGCYVLVRSMLPLQQLLFGGIVLAANGVLGFSFLYKKDKDIAILQEQ